MLLMADESLQTARQLHATKRFFNSCYDMHAHNMSCQCKSKLHIPQKKNVHQTALQLGQVLLSPWSCSCPKVKSLGAIAPLQPAAYALFSLGQVGCWHLSAQQLQQQCTAGGDSVSPAGAQSHDCRMRLNHTVLMHDSVSPEADAEAGRLQTADTVFATSPSQAGLAIDLSSHICIHTQKMHKRNRVHALVWHLTAFGDGSATGAPGGPLAPVLAAIGTRPCLENCWTDSELNRAAGVLAKHDRAVQRWTRFNVISTRVPQPLVNNCQHLDFVSAAMAVMRTPASG